MQDNITLNIESLQEVTLQFILSFYIKAEAVNDMGIFHWVNSTHKSYL